MTSLFDRVMKTPKPTITFTWIPTAYISNPLAPTVNELLGQIKSPFNLFKEFEVTAPAKPDYARMERKELMDRIDLLDNALAATEDNVRTYMRKAKEAEAKVGPQGNLTIARLEAAVREQDEQIAVLEQDLANQKSKYKGKLKECGAVIGTLKGMIKELKK